MSLRASLSEYQAAFQGELFPALSREPALRSATAQPPNCKDSVSIWPDRPCGGPPGS